jgi:hypothetical protein
VSAPLTHYPARDYAPARHSGREAHSRSASQAPTDTHHGLASHTPSDAQGTRASRRCLDLEVKFDPGDAGTFTGRASVFGDPPTDMAT